MKIPIYLDENIYCIDFSENEKYQLKEGKFYYLADSYKEPTKVKFIEWVWLYGLEHINIFCCCSNNSKIEYFNPSSLFKTKEKASEKYLNKVNLANNIEVE